MTSILVEKPEARPKIYAYAIDDAKHKGQLKVGQTTRDVKKRVAEQTKTAGIEARILVESSPTGRTGRSSPTTSFAHGSSRKGFENVELEWMRCTVEDVLTAITELRTRQKLTGTHHETFAMRDEQARRGHHDLRLLPVHLGRRRTRRPAVSLEREDALRQDLRQLPARKEARC